MVTREDTAIILVSHSTKLASGLQELIRAMAHDVLVQTAAGDEDGGLGTQAEAIVQAIRTTGAPHVLLFFDLGSALMNAELAMEMIGMEDTNTEVTLVDAPLVEGAFAAAMSIQTGNSASEAVQAAEKTREERKRQ